jgi:hypothetical protein
MSEFSRAIEEEKNQFNGMLNSMGLHEEEINAALRAFDRAELHRSLQRFDRLNRTPFD